MSDWKKRIDNRLESEGARRAKKAAAKSKRKDQIAEKAKKRTHAWNMFWHQLRFRCCVCGIASEKPAVGGGTYYPLADRSDPYYDDWSKPGDMNKCSDCKKWAHVHEIHKGICKNCA